MKLMEKFKFFSTTLGININNSIINWGCCANTKNNDFNTFDSVIYPSYIFDRFNISKEKLTKFIKNLSLLNNNKVYQGEITVIPKDKQYYSFNSQIPYINLNLVNPKTNINILISSYPKQFKSITISNTIEDLFNINDSTKNKDFIEFSSRYHGSFISIHIIKDYITSNRADFDISIIKDVELLKIVSSYKKANSYTLTLDVSVSDQIIPTFNPDLTFYNIPISNKSWSGSQNGLIRFILINLLRTFASGYSINIINIFNVIRSKYPDQKSFNQIAYFLFSCLAIDYALLNSEINTRTADKGHDYQILYLMCDKEGGDVRGCKEFKLYCKSKKDSDSTGEYDSIFDWIIDDTDISDNDEDDYDEDDYDGNDKSFNTITITLPELLEIYEHLQKNYTKKLIKALKWN